MDEELSRFKGHINLTEYAASCGYSLDRRQSSRSSATMRHANGDKIIIAKSENGDWIYFSVRDDSDNGTIIDFLQNRGGGSLGNVRKTLRNWLGSSRPVVLVEHYIPQLLPMSQDRRSVVMAWEQAKFRGATPYLIGRGLGDPVLGQERFVERFKIDKRGNVLFPHYDRDGLCGFEVKNKNFTGFATGGIKGLWSSICKKTDRTLVFTESAIDAVSYHVLFPDDQARYMSTGGAMNPQQPTIIRAALERMPEGSLAIFAFDADEGGEKLFEEIKRLVPSGLTVHRPIPSVGKDWNEALKNKIGIA